jgi:hypothetical protein
MKSIYIALSPDCGKLPSVAPLVVQFYAGLPIAFGFSKAINWFTGLFPHRMWLIGGV